MIVTIEVLLGIGGFLLTFSAILSGAIIYIITQLHKIDKKVKSPQEINDMIKLEIFRHIERCRDEKTKKEKTTHAKV